jgi:hypothetical protein
MEFVLLHRRYLRTCNICGDHWEVSRQEARPLRKMRRPRVVSPGGTITGATLDVRSSVDAFTAAMEVWQAYRRCPHCGIDDFTQTPVRRPASD